MESVESNFPLRHCPRRSSSAFSAGRSTPQELRRSSAVIDGLDGQNTRYLSCRDLSSLSLIKSKPPSLSFPSRPNWPSPLSPSLPPSHPSPRACLMRTKVPIPVPSNFVPGAIRWHWHQPPHNPDNTEQQHHLRYLPTCLCRIQPDSRMGLVAQVCLQKGKEKMPPPLPSSLRS